MEAANQKVSLPKQELFCAWLSWFVPLVVFLLTVATFLPALQNGFIDWDDYETLLNNPHYRGVGWTELRWMFTTFHMGHYQPLSWMTFGLDYLLWGMEPFGYHLTNLLLHAANAVLFYFVAVRLLGLALSGPNAPREFPLQVAAGFAALLFSIHPLRVESVAWATERRDVLSGLFFLGTILCYLRTVTFQMSNRSRPWWMTASVLIYGFSLLSKASGVTLPLILLLLDVYPLGRVGGGPGKWFGPEARRVYWEKLPFLLLAVGAGVSASIAQYQAGAMIPLDKYGVLPRLAQAFFGVVFYLWKTMMPVGLSSLYELPAHLNPWDWRFLLAGVVVLVVSTTLFVARRRWPAGLASWLWYIVILAPVLGIAQSGQQMVADRYSYLSCLPWAVLLGAGTFYCLQLWFCGRIGSWGFALIGGLTVIVLVALGSLTWKQTQVWHDLERLWSHALAVGPESSFAHNNLGKIAASRGNLEGAIGHFRRALQINPAHADAHYNLGSVLAGRGSLEEAIQYYRQALRIKPTHVEAHNNLGIALASRGNLEEAIDHYRQALRVNPAHADAHNNLGVALAKRGELEEAANHFHRALQIDPTYAKAPYNLGVALASQGNLEEAIEHFREALRIQPEFAAARESLGRALALQGK